MNALQQDFTETHTARLLSSLLFLLLVPSIVHILFSWIGFNPTDDGFILAYARRILEGQVPHRDFISIRPAGSAFLHAPVVWLGGESTYWLSRLTVWFEFGIISWSWTKIIEQLLAKKFPSMEMYVLSITSFVLTAHLFPPMAWHSIDALLFISLGVLLCLRPSDGMKTLGYVLVGFSALFRQNFVLIIPATLFLLGDWRRLRHWLASGTASALYVLYLFIEGALPDAVSQLTAQTDVFTYGVKPYMASPGLSLGMIIGISAAMIRSSEASRLFGQFVLPKSKLLSSALILTGIFVILGALAFGRFVHSPAFGLFGMTLGTVLILLTGQRGRELRTGLLLLLTAWVVSISIGYNTSALFAGPMAIYIIVLFIYRVEETEGASTRRRQLTLISLGAVACVSFAVVRTYHPYREQPASELTYRMADVLDGFRHIRTNVHTYIFLRDLRNAVEQVETQRYAIVPDVPGYWATASAVNPLPLDWPQDTELNTDVLVEKVTHVLEQQRGNISILVQKVRADLLAQGFVLFGESEEYAIPHYVRQHFMKVGETNFFDIYR